MDPISEDLVEKMRSLGSSLKELFTPYGVTLLVFDYGNSGRMNYISTANREDMIASMKEFIAVHEGRKYDAVKNKQ